MHRLALHQSACCPIASLIPALLPLPHCSVVSPLSQAFAAYIGCTAVQEALDAADVTGGLSLGEYTALTFAGAMRYYCMLPNVCSIMQNLHDCLPEEYNVIMSTLCYMLELEEIKALRCFQYICFQQYMTGQIVLYNTST